MNRCLIFACVALVAVGVGASPDSPGAYRDRMAGVKLTVEEAQALEERIARNADDLQARSQLLAYYRQAYFRNPSHQRRHSVHVLWLIRNAPQARILSLPDAQIDPHSDADAYLAGKDAWSSHLERQPTNLTYLRHAATFFSEHQDRELVVGALRKGLLLDAEDSWWPMQLGHLYLRSAVFGKRIVEEIELPPGFDADALELPGGLAELLGHGPEERGSMGLQALEQLERAYELAGGGMRTTLLDSMATAAFLGGRYDEAEAHAKTMLESEADHGSDQAHIHKANIMLGRVALVAEDVPQAKFHLLEAARVSGGATIGSFGPNMRLAADLLERGEREVVLEYFELCANFWPSDKLKDWTALVKGGRKPDFGANLIY